MAQVLAKRYEVIQCLGSGGMGMVFVCKDLSQPDTPTVVVKMLYADMLGDRETVLRFRNEVSSAKQVSHPNVVKILDVVQEDALELYAMEYLDGGDLATYMAKHSPLPIPTIVSILTQMCAGVQALHEAGIIHRDLKPENVLLSASLAAKIADFGIARTQGGPRLTAHGGVVGTIDYISPEYLEHGQIDNRSDIFAIGALGYEMVTGKNPFAAKSVLESMTLRLRKPPTNPNTIRSDCPPALGEILLKALARDPAARYQTAAAMAEDLQNLER